MEKEPKLEIPQPVVSQEEAKLPYQENKGDFNSWFRKAAKEDWDFFLNNDKEKNGNMERYEILKEFLWDNCTYDELQIYLGTLRRNKLNTMLFEDDIYSKRPDLKKEHNRRIREIEKELEKEYRKKEQGTSH